MKTKIIIAVVMGFWLACTMCVMLEATVAALCKGDGGEALIFCLFWFSELLIVCITAHECVEWRKAK